jgi:nucleotide-binding universal stress UspA family protein
VGQGTYRNVVVGTDGSETAEDAVRHAGRLASQFGARLVIVTAFQPKGDELAKQGGAPDEIRWMLTDRAQAEEKAVNGRRLAAEEGAEEIVVQSVSAEPAEAILDAAKDVGADLIVVGSKGLTSPARFVLGAVANTVSHHAPCDVLIVHTAD